LTYLNGYANIHIIINNKGYEFMATQINN